MPKILHFGVGNFFRAHLAAYTNGLEEWEILGVSLRAPGVRDGLSAQGYEYTLAVQGQSAIRITAMTQILVAPEDPRAVLDAIVDPDVEILSLTVT